MAGPVFRAAGHPLEPPRVRNIPQPLSTFQQPQISNTIGTPSNPYKRSGIYQICPNQGSAPNPLLTMMYVSLTFESDCNVIEVDNVTARVGGNDPNNIPISGWHNPDYFGMDLGQGLFSISNTGQATGERTFEYYDLQQSDVVPITYTIPGIGNGVINGSRISPQRAFMFKVRGRTFRYARLGCQFSELLTTQSVAFAPGYAVRAWFDETLLAGRD